MRIQPPDLRHAGWFARLLAWATRRGVRQTTGKPILPDSTRAAAWHPPLMFGVMMMELAQLRMRSVPRKYKALVSLAAARRIGCPF